MDPTFQAVISTVFRLKQTYLKMHLTEALSNKTIY